MSERISSLIRCPEAGHLLCLACFLRLFAPKPSPTTSALSFLHNALMLPTNSPNNDNQQNTSVSSLSLLPSLHHFPIFIVSLRTQASSVPIPLSSCLTASLSLSFSLCLISAELHTFRSFRVVKAGLSRDPGICFFFFLPRPAKGKPSAKLFFLSPLLHLSNDYHSAAC